MSQIDPVFVLCCLAIVQLLALASACLARMAEGSLRESRYQRLCLGCLAMAGLATMASLVIGPTTCVFSGVALAVTILTATWDLGATVL
jgi:Asp/Glu/hydantoin racemase